MISIFLCHAFFVLRLDVSVTAADLHQVFKGRALANECSVCLKLCLKPTGAM